MPGETAELVRQGLLITVIGMGLVFAALALLWGIVVLLQRVTRDPKPAPIAPASAEESTGETALAQAGLAQAGLAQAGLAQAALTAERARVAAIAGAALMASAVPLQMEPPAGPAFEHGRTAPSWVTANRAIALEPWTPPRVKVE